MTTVEQQKVVALGREKPQRIELSQAKFVTLLSVSVHNVNRWANKQTPPFLLALKQIETLLRQRGKQGESLLVKYFEAQESQQ